MLHLAQKLTILRPCEVGAPPLTPEAQQEAGGVQQWRGCAGQERQQNPFFPPLWQQSQAPALRGPIMGGTSVFMKLGPFSSAAGVQPMLPCECVCTSVGWVCA